uniref:Zinc finger protein 292b n=1 Tax=Seriola dumerili TaxID=41447 RepID=A0A3B4T7Q4_SERDU
MFSSYLNSFREALIQLDDHFVCSLCSCCCIGLYSDLFLAEKCTLLEYAGRWKIEEEPLPLVEVYIVALLSYAQASPYLSLQCENVPLVVERLSLTLQENGLTQLSLLSALAQYDGVWTNRVLQGLLSNEIEEFLVQEGQVLLEMRVKQLMKEKQLGKAALLAKTCSECPLLQGKGPFKQMYLVCLCATSEQDRLMDELSKEDCRDALEMICNLESDGDETAAFSLCAAFLSRQLLRGDTYCAWELTLFWSKLLKRLEPSEQAFLDRCRQMSLLSKTMYHILFLIKVIQSEMDSVGLPVCIEMCIRALRLDSDDGNTKATVCKTISCLLPSDLEVKRACQLTEFLLEPTVDSYYAVETLYNEPDQKLEEENMPVPNSLRCELLLVFKTQWPFDPEFWDWKTLKRHCLALMGEEASIVSSIDLLNDTESPEEEEDSLSKEGFNNIPDHLVSGTYELKDITDKKQKNREMKKLREKGFISARFRNWQAYMQYCVLCDKEFLGHRIVRHAQTHLSGGVYSCPICAQTFTSKDTLIPHVTSHVKQSCKERLTAMKTNKKLANPKTAAPVIAALKAKTENELYENGDSPGQNGGSAHNVQARVERCNIECSDDNICPVGKCRRTFKFFKNLIAHVKAHGDDEEAKTFLEMQTKKVVCQYCRRHFVNVTHLNDHLQVHCGVKPYICIQLNCKASFLSNTELLIHRKTHSVFKARCMFPNCGKVFNEAFKLYDHEAKHYKTFTCKVVDCGKVLHSQQQLDLHQKEHATQEEKPSSEQTSQNIQPGPSLIEQMLSDQTPVKLENSQENWSSESAVNPDQGRLPVSIEDLLKSSQAPVETLGHYRVKHEPQNPPFPTSQSLSSSVIQPRERFHCAFELCTRHYSSYRSVSKHMKTVHPDFYEQWKVTRTKIKITYTSAQSAPSVGHLSSVTSPQNQHCNSSKVPVHGVQRQNVIQSPPYTNMGTTSNYNTLHSHSSSAHNHNASLLMENVLNPIVLSQLGNSEPTQLSASQQQCMTEIQSAFERLNLVREMSDQMSASMKQNTNVPTSQTALAKVQSRSSPSSTSVKPFACENENCTFSSMSSEALWKHLSKTHNYTLEMVNVVKKRYGQYAPFKCQKCSKTFTRNSNLRTHYQSAHKLSAEEIADLDMKRRLANGLTSLDRQCAVNRQSVVKPSMDVTKKTKEKKSNSEDATSPYRPYRCVHQGCVAAFTIQHNLILHYRAVHQSALSALEVNKEQDQSEGLDEIMEHDGEEPEAEIPQISEFRCQVKDCSRVFQEVPNLLQHYLQLHEFSLDKVGNLLSGIKLGRFACGHQGCTVSFTILWKYIGHVKEQHKDIRLSKPEQINGSFKCEIEGCDRSYATKSNLLRHVMKKHQDLYQPKLKNQQIKEDGMKQNSKTLLYQITKTSNGKENIESNKKIIQRANDSKRVSKSKNNHWTKYGKPSLKSKVEASAMCTKKFPLQYPCMIKGCESVMKSERSILKHYMGHGLSEKYLEQQRSHFIFCKKVPRQKCRSIRSDDSKSDNTSDLSEAELAADTSLEGGEYGYSKPVLRKRTSTGIPAALFDSKLSNDESSDGSVVLKRKRGRPRKLIEKIVKRKKIPRTTKTDVVYSKDDESDSSCPAVLQEEMTEQSAPLASFKPMGFEMSFLKFLEQSNKSEHTFTRKVDVPETWRKTSSVNTKDTCVRFSNPQNLKSLSKVKIIIDAAFSGVTDLMLKQLQAMQPVVVKYSNEQTPAADWFPTWMNGWLLSCTFYMNVGGGVTDSARGGVKALVLHQSL